MFLDFNTYSLILYNNYRGVYSKTFLRPVSIAKEPAILAGWERLIRTNSRVFWREVVGFAIAFCCFCCASLGGVAGLVAAVTLAYVVGGVEAWELEGVEVLEGERG